MNDRVEFSDFEGKEGEKFTAICGERKVALELVSATSKPTDPAFLKMELKDVEGNPIPKREVTFNLIFRAAPHEDAPQDNYAISGESGGEKVLCMAPVGPEDTHNPLSAKLYQVVVG